MESIPQHKKQKENDKHGSSKHHKTAEETNLVSVTKKRSITLPSGAVDTLTLFMVSSSSHKTFVTSRKEKKSNQTKKEG